MTASHAPLAPAARPRRCLAHRSPLLQLAVLAGLATALDSARGRPPCRAAIHRAPALALRVCEREYARTGDPATGARLAEAHRGAGDLAAASAIARGLLATPARGDALRVLGEVAVAEHRLADALGAFERARALHQLDGQPAELVGDAAAIDRVQRALAQDPPGAR